MRMTMTFISYVGLPLASALLGAYVGAALRRWRQRRHGVNQASS
jgi:hypothetical protein